jgi:CMP-N-acetylneuraminic acid synthetase
MKIFIPIKENSERVPRKNFRQFGEDLLYRRCLLRLLKFEEMEIWVDTDSEEIFNDINTDPMLSRVNVYSRDNSLIGDNTPVNLLIENFVNTHCSDNDIVCQVHVTSPFLSGETIVSAHKKMVEGKYDSVASVNVFHSRFWTMDKCGYRPVNHNPLKLEKTQDLESMYEENSAFYMFASEGFLRHKNRIGINPLFFSVPAPENIDIDTEEDFDFALKTLNSL